MKKKDGWMPCEIKRKISLEVGKRENERQRIIREVLNRESSDASAL